jgi:hypothetical protein
MSGPIVRTGTTPAFWKNWEQAFGGTGKKKAGSEETKPVNAFASKKATKKAAKKVAKAAPKKAAPRKAAAKKKK